MMAATLPGQGDLAQTLDQAERVVAGLQQLAIDQTSEQRRTFDLLATVREVVDLTRLSFRGEPIAIEVTGEPGLVLDSYPGHVGQVLGQLIRNAVVHGLRNGRSGTIAVRVWPTVRDDVRITVHDDGAGIPPEDLPRVFAPFFTTRPAQGRAGLGLALCRDIVNGMLGGRIEIVSPPEAGTTVTVTLPRHAPRSAG
jgi:signal transduction histidine kinase